jgi:hypothetical protein
MTELIRDTGYNKDVPSSRLLDLHDGNVECGTARKSESDKEEK